MTNEEWLKSLPIEELAKFLTYGCLSCVHCDECQDGFYTYDCTESIREKIDEVLDDV